MGEKPEKPRRLKTWLLKLAVLFVALAAAILIVAIALRIYSDHRYPKIRELDDALGWKHVPGSSRAYQNEDGGAPSTAINDDGHRGPVCPIARTPGKYRVLALGDSFTEGTQVEEKDLFTSRLARSAPDLEVINAGVGGYGTVQQYLALRDRWLAYSPDLVIVMFFGNDLADNCLPYYAGIGPRPHAVVESGGVRIVESFRDDAYLRFCMPAPFRSFLIRHCYREGATRLAS
ncbi:MAG: hypothetical protein CMJ83_11605 [Planctomycetes bacterium]|nr:hypothetical protein [Planctomycetota bacterium]